MFFSTICEKPPTLYALLNSIVNFDAEDKTKITNLASAGRNKVFNFSYPLSEKVSKEEFETLILNKFIMRRIGFETFTAFQIALNVKLNEIMPVYNKMFDMLSDWDIFNDGEVVTRNQENNNTGSEESNSGVETTNTTNIENNTTTNNSNTITGTDTINNTSDRRLSETPQNEISEVKNGKYITNYNYDTNNTTNTTNSTNTAEITTNSTENGTNTQNTTQNNTINKNNNEKIEEIIKRTPADKMSLYKEFINNKNSIYTMIFKELDCLFYGLA